jgi:hypothetical protein
MSAIEKLGSNPQAEELLVSDTVDLPPEPLKPPNVTTVDSLTVKMRAGESEIYADLRPIGEDRDVPRIVGEVRGSKIPVEDSYTHTEKTVVAYLREQEGHETSWIAVEQGAIIAPMITVDGLKIAIHDGKTTPPVK